MPKHIKVPTSSGPVECIDLKGVVGERMERLPHVLRLLAENHLRETGETEALVAALETFLQGQKPDFEFSFRPNRILMHDTTCTPALADIAAMRDVLAEEGVDPAMLTPDLPVEVSVDHSVAVDVYGSATALQKNTFNEIERNTERYTFMKWAARNMATLNVNPPGTGIMHTINLEQLATLIVRRTGGLSHPDMMIGTDSHTPMVNGIGILAWGVGGLEAETAMFGQALSLAFPEIVGIRLKGQLQPGVLATDLALEVTHQLREIGVTGSFVEFFGPGIATLSADDRAVVSNMAPEYGASTGFFPPDQESIAYLRRTGRQEDLLDTIRPMLEAQGLWFDPAAEPKFSRMIEIDLSAIKPLIAGPRRPQDRISASEAESAVVQCLGRDLPPPPLLSGPVGVPDGAVGIAAITSCTNTTSPELLLAAGILAQKAHARGLRPPEWVKTSLAPGSPSAQDLLRRTGLLGDLEAIGFGIVGFGCTTCIGNSGPLPARIEHALHENKAVVAVLSGNRNFPGRVHPKLDLGYLASPPLVIAFALKGSVKGDILADPISTDIDGKPVYLSEIWPSAAEIASALSRGIEPENVPAAFEKARGNAEWARLEAPVGPCFPWDTGSRILRRPAFVSREVETRLGNYEAAPLMVLGDDMTTDHISPAGWIAPDSAAGKWLVERGGDPSDLNVYASYRGNWEVMLRGLFTNRSAKNHLAPDLAPATTELADGSRLPVFEAAEKLQKEGVSAILLAGHRYGMGSSRDWAAKGAALLGVRAIVARSFERIHRSNLIGMGILPIEIADSFVPAEAGILPDDRFQLEASPEHILPRQEMTMKWKRSDGTVCDVAARAAVDTRQEIELLRAGGVLPSIIKRSLANRIAANTETKRAWSS
ncbi:aconitate hydratase AcnA [uncultured Roseibium sp.]|uniref:aconitate hydratase AcnA n=1 Tax=uncultured Roseibium sp. TaxID=1936171 RepID=UPI0026375856|nr:aconitate hydratase AcnA [uncultured Roseibium sp.]